MKLRRLARLRGLLSLPNLILDDPSDLTLNYLQIVCGLKIEPEIRGRAEITGQPQGSCRRNRAPFANNVVDSWRREELGGHL
jgi:hypothetical protein